MKTNLKSTDDAGRDDEFYKDIIKKYFTPKYLENIDAKDLLNKADFDELFRGWQLGNPKMTFELLDRTLLYAYHFVGLLFEGGELHGDFEDALQNTWLAIRTYNEPMPSNCEEYQKTLKSLVRKFLEKSEKLQKDANIDLKQEKLESLDAIEEEIASTLQTDEHLLEEERAQQFAKIINTLSPREITVLLNRYYNDEAKKTTLDEIAKNYGLTRERIRQVEAQAIRKMRHPTRLNKLRDYDKQ